MQPYQPSLSASWLFQRSMSLRIGQAKAKAGPRGRVAEGAWLPPNHINRLMSCNFACMQVLPLSGPSMAACLLSHCPSCLQLMPSLVPFSKILVLGFWCLSAGDA